MSSISDAVLATVTAIRNYASKLNSELSLLKQQIASISGPSIWFGANAPTDPSKYLIWFKLAGGESDIFFNYGSNESPIWLSPIKTSQIPSGYGTTYRTTEKQDGKYFHAIRLDAGHLPNQAVKLITLPTTVTDNWGPVETRSFDLSNSYLRSSDDRIVPLSHVFGPDHPDCNVELRNGMIAITTSTDLSDWQAVITLKYRLV